jgi:hypothetical protein
MRPTVRWIAAAALTATTACSRENRVDAARDQAAVTEAATAANAVADESDLAARGITGGAAAAAPAAVAPAAPPPPPMPGAKRSAAPQSPRLTGDAPDAPSPGAAPLVIRVGSASLEVDSLDGGVSRVRAVVQTIPGAYVANMSFEGGREQARRATLEVKVPAPAFDRLVAGLAPIGRVETVNVSAEDVSEEFVDLTARAENARRLESRLVDLLARRTGKLQEVLAVERELARVREEIERYDGRLRFLRTRASMSTLAITVHEPAPVLGANPAANPIADAFRDGWRNFVAFVAAVISLSGVLIPLALLGYVAWRLVRRFHRATETKAA